MAVDGSRNEFFDVESQVAHDICGESSCVCLVVYGKCAGVTELFCVTSQHSDARGVERRHPHFFGDGPYQACHSILHFLGGFVGESDGEDAEWADVVFLDEVGDAVGENSSFS